MSLDKQNQYVSGLNFIELLKFLVMSLVKSCFNISISPETEIFSLLNTAIFSGSVATLNTMVFNVQ